MMNVKCQSDNNPTIEQTTAEGHQWVFNVARIPAPVGVHSYLIMLTYHECSALKPI